MNPSLDIAARTVLIGAGATICMDLWAIFLRRAFNIPSLDFALLGRWVGHMPRGRFAHDSIKKAEPVRGERILGWTTHYAIGITFASLLLMLFGPEWADAPTILPAIIIGFATLPAPLLIMQPAMGMGLAASRTPRPNAARLKSLITHLVFGFGLYIAAVLFSVIWAGGTRA